MNETHTVLLVFTAFVTFVLVELSWALAKLLPTKSTGSSTEKQDHLAEYGRAWCVQQAVPFADKLLGVSGAMDNRMLVPWQSAFSFDWAVRLPLIVLSAIWPSPSVLFVAHVANIASWACWMPAVWDHMVWAALLEIVFVLAVLGGGGSKVIADRFLKAARVLLIILYFSAAFWKLTTSWYDTYTSCAPVLLSELLSGLAPASVLPGGSMPANFLLKISPVFVAALEFAVPIALIANPPAGVLLALVFHQTINLMPMTYAGGFSLAMVTRLVMYVPGTLAAALKSSAPFIAPSAIVAAVAGIMVAVHDSLDSAACSFLALTFLYLRGMTRGGLIDAGSPQKKSSSEPILARCMLVAAVVLGIGYGFLAPIAGVMGMASSTMYGNLKQFGGTNHLLVPTGLLQGYYAESKDASWMTDAFGGGLLRVDFTNSSVLQQLAPADATSQLPKHARALRAGINASSSYYELYAARNYFGRSQDLENTALHNRGTNGPRMDDPPYAQPAYELRRVLKLARDRGESFKVVYTRLPASGSPGTFRDYTGVKITLEENPAAGTRTCTIGGAPCASDEVALQPPPPRWLTWMLHPYPMPLLDGDSTEVHCST
ncbi:unnamed protein product [Polarella glacialis]|uniref:Uncharacterized protein n=2 Tax=Polarella glacialis TaxID=89957 RepID=A0A813KV34_POLGL|nr:unnamed protein product [Polarella glacialis]